ncbi:Cthe_2314 family HEPN domain-containing protein [Cohnella nanjingensis]|uniref:Cthe-2314-like HEPN domain-containing protein n=1 Tax=Cohnella nanjingensis TaxID=1387779 RepID=A0A7X0VEN4_9BACL|nr:Cthe_2314 family HEPN domain-containing protein [Cohnella nanjingensis]MBB6670931.1 hypothetical protein [Cohnella nanjingensis]
MLRAMFGEPAREWEGPLLETVQGMDRFIRRMRERGQSAGSEAAAGRKFQIRAEGLLRSLDELEQSRYAAKRFAERVTKPAIGEMSPGERLDYYRHVYYDKNAYIRLFSLLDKLGVLLNDYLALETERMKAHFSYFTVLRNMRLHGLHPPLSEELNGLKDRHEAAFGRLRKRRNLEIHHMNAELQDDLLLVMQGQEGHPHLENIADHMNDLDEGWEMAYRSLTAAFGYMSDRHRPRPS